MKTVLRFLCIASLMTASCSKRSDVHKVESDSDKLGEQGERETQPSPDDIIEDCFAFAWLTKATPVNAPNTNCPQCPQPDENREVLKFESAEVKKMSCTEDTCEADVTIRASFNPSKGGTVTGGLAGWIPLPEREAYARGETPGGERAYEIKITYRRDGEGWRAIDFASR